MNNIAIAAQLRMDYAAGNYTVTEGCMANFTMGSFKVQCKNTPDAVYSVVEKFRKGLPRSVGTLKAPTRPVSMRQAKFSTGVFNRFMLDLEAENAVAYARQYSVDDLPAVVLRTVNGLDR